MFNQLTVVGNLGNDPELRMTNTGTPVAGFNLAVHKSWTDQQGERHEKTTWMRVTTWRKLAETVSEHLTKGRLVLVVGEVEEARPWTDREGNARATIEVTATIVRFLNGKNGHGGDAEPAADDESQEF